MTIDSQILDFIAHHRVAFLDTAFRATMRAGTSPLVLGLVGLVGLLYIARTRQWRAAMAVAAAFIVSTLVCSVVKDAIGRTRPPARLALLHVAGASMPSTHASRTAAVAVVIVLLARWPSDLVRHGAALLVVAGVAFVGAALVYLGVHWLTDVLAGWALGGLVGFIAARLATVDLWGMNSRARRSPANP